MATYSISISMNQETVNDLSANNFVMYGFKAVRTTAAGAPLVWFGTTSYGIDTDLNWEQRYQAYTSKSQIVPGGTVRATNAYDIDLDQTLVVVDKSGIGDVDTGAGTPRAISVLNQTDTQFTCGISEMQPTGAVTPLCAFPLFGNNLDVMAPVARVLLMFTTVAVNTGTVVYQAYSPGVLIDLTDVNSRAIAYDINTGWSWGGGPWARQIAPSEDLRPLLVENDPALNQTVRAPAGASPAR